jgi:hypothetical protein
MVMQSQTQTHIVHVPESEVMLLHLKMRYEVGDEAFRRFLAENLDVIPCCTETIQ